MLLTEYEKIIFHKQIETMLGNPNLEFEIRFGSKITSEEFRSVIKRLNQFNLVKASSSEELDISFKNERSSKSNFRITLKGNKNIMNYCKNNEMPVSDINSSGDNIVEKMYKNRYYWKDETHSDIIQSIDTKIEELDVFSKKQLLNMRKKLSKNSNLDVYNYQFRSSLNWEIPYNTRNALSGSIRNMYEGETKRHRVLLSNNNKLASYLKFFRYKKRVTYHTKDQLFKIDLTVTKNSNFNINSGFSKSYIESGLLEQPENYEIEIEYIGDKYNNTSDIKTYTPIVFNSVIKNTGIILQVLQKSFYLISKKEEKNVLESYKNLVSYNLENRVTKKINILAQYTDYLEKKKMGDVSVEWSEVSKELEIIDELKYPKYFYDLIDTHIEQFQNQFDVENKQDYLHNQINLFSQEKKLQYTKKSKLTKKNLFIGPKPITMEIPHLYNKSPINILYDYTVTDKADGLGCILYIAGNSGSMGSLNNLENLLLSGLNIDFTCNESGLTLTNLKTTSDNIGNGAIISLVIDDYKIVKIVLENSGSGYEIGDIITVSKSVLSEKGCTAATDLKITLNSEHIISHDDILHNVYLIDSNLKVIKTGIKCMDLSDIVLNGELIYINSKPEYYAYDVYVSETNGNMVDCINFPFIVDNESYKDYSRLYHMKNIVEKIKESCIGKLFNIACKKFYQSSVTKISNITEEEHIELSDIYNKSGELWDNYLNGSFNYRLDGMIYTPKYLPVSYSKNFDYDLNTGVTWNYNLKWKPPEENSIDFFVQIEQEKINQNLKRDKIRHHFEKTEYGNKVIPYKTLYLYSGSRTLKKIGRHEIYSYEARKFIPSTPFDNEAFIAKIPLTGNQILGKYDKQPIENNTVVEFTYLNFQEHLPNFQKNNGFRWNPLRTRVDKTAKYRSGYNNKIKNYQIFKNMIVERQIYQILYDILNDILRNDSQYPQLHQNIVNSKGSRNFLENFKILINYLHINSKLSEIETVIKNNNKKSYVKRKIINFSRLLKYSVINYKVSNISGEVIFNLNNETISDTLISLLVTSNLETITNIHTENDLKVDIQYGNDFKTANNIWKNIHYPITEEMITTGNNIPNESDYQIYYDSLENRSRSGLYNMQVYHNKFIKGKLLLGVVTKLLAQDSSKNIKLLDMGCGKGGDLHKWKLYDVDQVLGIDIVQDNIMNDTNGAQLRYLNLKYQSEQLSDKYPKVDFLVGDCSKIIRDYSAFEEIETAKKILSNTEKFNIISSQFAFHYFFKTKNSLNNAIKNIHDNLEEGGYFIGTCFDGKTIVELLKTENEIIGTRDDRIIWKIKRNYNDETIFTNPQNYLGQSVSVFISSINNEVEEYLVDFDFLVEELKKNDIILLSEDEINSIPELKNMQGELQYSSSNMFENVYNYYLRDEKNHKVLEKLENVEKKLSNMYRFFIFKKKTAKDKLLDRAIQSLITDYQLQGHPILNKAIDKYIKISTSKEHIDNLIKQLHLIFSVYLQQHIYDSEELSNLMRKYKEKTAGLLLEKIIGNRDKFKISEQKKVNKSAKKTGIDVSIEKMLKVIQIIGKGEKSVVFHIRAKKSILSTLKKIDIVNLEVHNKVHQIRILIKTIKDGVIPDLDAFKNFNLKSLDEIKKEFDIFKEKMMDVYQKVKNKTIIIIDSIKLQLTNLESWNIKQTKKRTPQEYNSKAANITLKKFQKILDIFEESEYKLFIDIDEEIQQYTSEITNILELFGKITEGTINDSDAFLSYTY